MNSFSRRSFLIGGTLVPLAALRKQQSEIPNPQSANPEVPWFRRTFLWGQTNINEADPQNYDLDWWRSYWKKTGVEGIIVNAGGIVAYYPSAHPLHHRARFLGDRDLFGDVLKAARAEGLAVLARMDCNRAHEDFYNAHPDWFAQTADAKPVRAADLYVTCIHSPYYDEYIPGLLREIAGRYRPEGFADNSWSGLERDTICHCPSCRTKFRAASGHDLPSRPNWEDSTYRQWIQWNYDRRTEIWDLYNRVAREAGGKDCLWIGMLADNPAYEGRRFRDLKAICARSEMLLLDHQGRNANEGFENNADAGKRLHGLVGWDKFMPESMAMYNRNPSFRKAANSPAEAKLWMLEGIAGGIQTWWHHVGALQEDRRQFDLAADITVWAGANRKFLTNRKPVADIGLVWSQGNADFYGRDRADQLTVLPYRGFVRALVGARLPYIPVNADHIERDGSRLAVLILPALGALTEGQVAAVRKFVDKGGNLVVTGETGMYDEWGQARGQWPFGDILGVEPTGALQREAGIRMGADHSYLRLQPDIGAQSARHKVLEGFEKTNILPFGGWLVDVKARPDATAVSTYIPDFPVYPPETSWMREPRTDRPCVVVHQFANGSRCVYLAADLDRAYALWGLPDHARLLANAVAWAAGPAVPLQVEGPGILDCNLYSQDGALILHLVNLTTASAWPGAAREVVSVGPLSVRVRRPAGVKLDRCRSLVTGKPVAVKREGDWAKIEVASVGYQEVVVFE